MASTIVVNGIFKLHSRKAYADCSDENTGKDNAAFLKVFDLWLEQQITKYPEYNFKDLKKDLFTTNRHNNGGDDEVWCLASLILEKVD